MGTAQDLILRSWPAHMWIPGPNGPPVHQRHLTSCSKLADMTVARGQLHSSVGQTCSQNRIPSSGVPIQPSRALEVPQAPPPGCLPESLRSPDSLALRALLFCLMSFGLYGPTTIDQAPPQAPGPAPAKILDRAALISVKIFHSAPPKG